MNEQKIAFTLYFSCFLVFLTGFLMEIAGKTVTAIALFAWLGCNSIGALCVLIWEKWKGDKKRNAENND